MKIAFIKSLRLGKANQDKLVKVEAVINDYKSQGYRLTLRQLYYQLVTENIIANNDREYDKLSSLLTKGRMAGMIDWDAIEDRIRVPRLLYSAETLEEAVKDTVETFRHDRLADQDNYIELWVEKDALSNVLSRKTHHYHIRLMVNRGYSSTTAMFDAYNRIMEQISEGKKVTVLYLGDHDPSGLDMVRDIFDRLFLMLYEQPTYEMLVAAKQDDDDAIYDKWASDERSQDEDTGYYNGLKGYILEHFEIRHIALTSAQVLQYNPPENPAKLADPRAEWYIGKFGRSSWEVDALNPRILHEIIDTNVKGLIDEEKFAKMLKKEEECRTELAALPTMKAKIDAIGEIMKTKIPKKPTAAQLKRILREFRKAYEGDTHVGPITEG